MLLKCLLVLMAVSQSQSELYITNQLKLLGKKEGAVGNENFTYYYIHYLGNIILSLQTIEGDADMYVSEINMNPTYNPDTYDVHSATCGEDIIRIPSGFKSPISVGIYGHSAYEVSSFTLSVFKIREENDEHRSSVSIIEEGNNESTPEIKVDPKNEKKIVSIKSKSKKNDLLTIFGAFSPFLEFIELIFA